MKFVLVIIMCSGYQVMCMEPFKFTDGYDDVYTCLMDGYQKSIDKTEEIGRKEINKHKIFFKFDCYESKAYKTAIQGFQLHEKI